MKEPERYCIVNTGPGWGVDFLLVRYGTGSWGDSHADFDFATWEDVEAWAEENGHKLLEAAPPPDWTERHIAETLARQKPVTHIEAQHITGGVQRYWKDRDGWSNEDAPLQKSVPSSRLARLVVPGTVLRVKDGKVIA